MTDESANDPETTSEPPLREVRYRHSPSFVDVLRELGASLLVSTYQAGKLVTVGVADGQLHFSFHQFEQAMGVAVSRDQLAIGTKGQVWFLHNDPRIARSLEPAGRYDSCYLARRAMVTGSIHCHEIAWSGQELWVVNTLFSCLATLHPEYSFVPRWQPPFITELIGQDRCHLNGLAMVEGRPAYVTVMAESNEPAGWRPTKSESGCLLDVSTGQAVSRGMAMPHSPRVYQNRIWVLNSGYGTLETVDPRNGQRDVVARMPGYTRGLSMYGPLAFVGLSRIRETAVFGGVPIAANRDELKCGVGVVDLRTGNTVATLEFQSGVEEIFAVEIVPAARCVHVCGPRPDQDMAQDIWIVPRPDQVPQITRVNPTPLAAGLPAANIEPEPRENARGLAQQGLQMQQQRRVGEALQLFQRAVAIEPGNAELLNHLGNALQDCGRQDEALDYYRLAVTSDGTFAPALQNLGYLLVNQGQTEEGLGYLERAQAVKPADVNRVMLATALPIVYASQEDLHTWRRRITSKVQELVDQRVTLDTTNMLIPTNFFAVYQGENDRSVNENLGKIHRGINLCRSGPRERMPQEKIRVGFLSAYFRDHTIGRLNLGRIQRLTREKFEVYVLSVGRHQDPLAEQFRKGADHFVELGREVAAVRRKIADLNLDLLMFADVGMDALTYSLAFSRMAPLQCVTWGHPVTTGSPHMDYFVSSELLETAEAQDHYTERLARLPSLATYYQRPVLVGAERDRQALGLPRDRNIYLCPQTLFKFHPEFDEILAQILRRDPRGELVLIEGRVPHWTQLLRERFTRVMPDVIDRIRFLPAQPNQAFLHLMAVADVILDPVHFGGGNTSYEGLAMGTPIITLPGPFLRSRITRALYAKMKFMDLVVDTPAAYVELALRLAEDSRFRAMVTTRILESRDVLFEDPQEVRDLETFFLAIAR